MLVFPKYDTLLQVHQLTAHASISIIAFLINGDNTFAKTMEAMLVTEAEKVWKQCDTHLWLSALKSCFYIAPNDAVSRDLFPLRRRF